MLNYKRDCFLSLQNYKKPNKSAIKEKIFLVKKTKKIPQRPKSLREPPLWALTDSNRRPSACKADALNQLS